MKLSKEQIISLSDTLVDRLVKGDFIRIEGDRAGLISSLNHIITEELTIEDRINNEVREILKTYEAEIDRGNLDYHMLFQKTKKQLAKDRGIIL